MFVNLHEIPPDKALFTFYVGDAEREEVDEVDLVLPSTSYTDELVRAFRESDEAKDYDNLIPVVGIVMQTRGIVVFDYRRDGGAK